ncbi:MAG: hypothetical protein J3Q66DRAFT_369391 [Benniella sp.]|nr:MAG: hypothetical protein J3Q66DRAFT_369391 [Benniella sp.]
MSTLLRFFLLGCFLLGHFLLLWHFFSPLISFCIPSCRFMGPVHIRNVVLRRVKRMVIYLSLGSEIHRRTVGVIADVVFLCHSVEPRPSSVEVFVGRLLVRVPQKQGLSLSRLARDDVALINMSPSVVTLLHGGLRVLVHFCCTSSASLECAVKLLAAPLARFASGSPRSTRSG